MNRRGFRRFVTWLLSIGVAIAVSVLAAWLYDRYVSSVRYFEFFDSSPLSIAMRQCYSVPESLTRLLVIPVRQVREIDPEGVNLLARLSDELGILDFPSLKSLLDEGYVELHDSLHLTEIRVPESDAVIASFRSRGISAFDVEASLVRDIKLGFSTKGTVDTLRFGSGVYGGGENGGCTVFNILILQSSV